MRPTTITTLVALVTLAAAAEAELRVSADFEGGSIGPCKNVAEDHLECAVKGEVDQDGRNRQASWYYFRLEGAAGREITIDLVDLPGEYNYKPSQGSINGQTPPVLSYDQTTWDRLKRVEYDADIPRLRLRLTPSRDPVFIAHPPPYTTRDLARLFEFLDRREHVSREVIGQSVEGRAIPLLTITNTAFPGEKKKVIWLMFRQHAWEAGSSWVGEGLIRYLVGPSSLAGTMREGAVVRIFPMCDPDGVARGGVRFNANGYDLNRNWDRILPDKMPEIQAQHQAIREWREAGRRIDLFLTVHNTETAEYIDGPPARAPAQYGKVLMDLFGLLKKETRFAPTRPPRAAPIPTAPGRMTVTQGLYNEFRLPALLMELAIARNPKTGRYPTIADRQRFGADLMRMIWRAVPPPTSPRP